MEIKTITNPSKIFAADNLTSQGNPVSEYSYNGKIFRGGWKTTNPLGTNNLAKAGRLKPIGNSLMYRRYFGDFPVTPITNVWKDLLLTGFSTTALLLKQRYEAGYNWPLGQGGGLAPLGDYIAACGYEATQGLIGSYFGIWDFKETKVNPRYVTMCQEVMRVLSQKHGVDYTYSDWIGWLPSHLLILSQAMEKAHTVDDPDAIMAAIRGGTFDTTGGTCPMSGEETYGSPVVFGNPGAICIVRGNQAIYLGEHPVDSIP